MSFVRVNRYSPRGGGRKVLKLKKKKPSVKQEWDVSYLGQKRMQHHSRGIDRVTRPLSLRTLFRMGSASDRLKWAAEPNMSWIAE